jgi:hypothetical protein
MMHAYEMPAREMYAHEMYAHEIHAREVHAREVHARGVHEGFYEDERVTTPSHVSANAARFQRRHTWVSVIIVAS